MVFINTFPFVAFTHDDAAIIHPNDIDAKKHESYAKDILQINHDLLTT